jgi:UDP-4-amino-4,6-dideoxy-N-acetyl-beta-L-altrosamine transaminase
VTQAFLPYGRQSIDEDDIEAVVRSLKSDFLTTGPTVAKFEELLSSTTGAAISVVCNSGTAALHMAAISAGLGDGDCVIVPTITFLASANAMSFVGAEVLFADCDPLTGLMRPEDFSAAIKRAKALGKKPRAVVPVHYSGQVCDMPAIHAIARAEGMVIIEDACHALGSRHGPNLESLTGDCRWSDMACFSFHPVKTIAMGEGGAVTTNNPEFAERLRLARNHGMNRNEETFTSQEAGLDNSGDWGMWYYEMQEPGYNYRACDLQCALGISQLKKLEKFAEKRRALRDRYYNFASELPSGVRLIGRAAECDPCPHLMTALFDDDFLGLGRNAVMNSLREMGIGTQVHYTPVHLQPYYRRISPDLALEGASEFYRKCLTLPLFSDMELTDIDRVIAALHTVASKGTER